VRSRGPDRAGPDPLPHPSLYASGEPTRNSATPIVVNGHGHTLTETCAGNSALVQEGEGAVTLSDLTVTGGDGDEGGALFTNGPATITGSVIRGNHAGSEGGGVLSEGTITVTHSLISDNTSGNSGAGSGFILCGTTKC